MTARIKTIGLFICLFFCAGSIFAQTTTEYFKDFDLQKSTNSKKANFLRTTTTSDSLLTIEVWDAKKKFRFSYKEYTDSLPTGVWTEFSENYKLINTYHFSELVYRRQKPRHFKGEFAEEEAKYENLNEYIMNNVEYPPEAVELGIQGRIFVEFYIDKEGNMSDIAIVRGVHPFLDLEAIRVIKSMGKWTPGKANGKVIGSYMILPITFKLG